MPVPTRIRQVHHPARPFRLHHASTRSPYFPEARHSKSLKKGRKDAGEPGKAHVKRKYPAGWCFGCATRDVLGASIIGWAETRSDGLDFLRRDAGRGEIFQNVYVRRCLRCFVVYLGEDPRRRAAGGIGGGRGAAGRCRGGSGAAEVLRARRRLSAIPRALVSQESHFGSQSTTMRVLLRKGMNIILTISTLRKVFHAGAPLRVTARNVL